MVGPWDCDSGGVESDSVPEPSYWYTPATGRCGDDDGSSVPVPLPDVVVVVRPRASSTVTGRAVSRRVSATPTTTAMTNRPAATNPMRHALDRPVTVGVPIDGRR